MSEYTYVGAQQMKKKKKKKKKKKEINHENT